MKQGLGWDLTGGRACLRMICNTSASAARQRLFVFRCTATACLTAATACGRLEFDAVRSDEPAGPQIVALQGASPSFAFDAEWLARDRLALVGSYRGTVRAGASALTSLTTATQDGYFIELEGEKVVAAQTFGATMFGEAWDVVSVDGKATVGGFYLGQATGVAGAPQAGRQTPIVAATVGPARALVPFAATQNAQQRALAARDSAVVAGGSFSGQLSVGAGAASVSASREAAYLAKFNVEGEGLRATASVAFPSTGYSVFNGVALLADGGVCAVGAYEGSFAVAPLDALAVAPATTAFVVRTDAALRPLWVHAFGRGVGYDVAVAPDDDCVVAGMAVAPWTVGATGLQFAGIADAMVLRLDATSGVLVWGHSWGGSANDSAHAVAVDASGRVVTFGKFAGDATINGTTLTSEGDNDAFVAVLNEDGSAVATLPFTGAGSVESPLAAVAVSQQRVAVAFASQGDLVVRDGAGRVSAEVAASQVIHATLVTFALD